MPKDMGYINSNNGANSSMYPNLGLIALVMP